MNDYEKEKNEKARRALIRCEQCSEAKGRPIYHGWKRSEGLEFKPVAEQSTER